MTELRTSAISAGGATRSTAPDVRPDAEPRPIAIPAQQAYGVLARAHTRGGIFDIVAYQDAILLSRACGTDPALAGALIGLVIAPLIGALVGVLIGERVARNRAAERLRDLFYLPPEVLFGQSRKNRYIRSADIDTARLWEYGAHQRVLELHLADGSTRRLQFDARFQSNSLAAATLRVSLGPNLEIEQRRFRPASVAAAAILVALTALIAGMVALIATGI